MQSQAIEPKKKSVVFVGLDDKQVDLAASRGQFFRKLYKYRRQQEKAAKRKEKNKEQEKKKREQDEKKRIMDATQRSVAFLCHIFTLQLDAEDVSLAQIFALLQSSFSLTLAKDADLMNEGDMVEQLPRTLLEFLLGEENPQQRCAPFSRPWDSDLVNQLQAWSQAAQTRQLFEPPPDRTSTDVVRSLKSTLTLVRDDALIADADNIMKRAGQEPTVGTSSNLKMAAGILLLAIRDCGAVASTHFVDRFISLEWLSKKDGMDDAQLSEVLLEARGIAPHISGHISSSGSSEEGSAGTLHGFDINTEQAYIESVESLDFSSGHRSDASNIQAETELDSSAHMSSGSI